MVTKRKTMTPLTLNEDGLEFNGERRDLISGSIHYWRLDPKLWDEIFARSRDLGVTFACTYIPWSVHETTPGIWDFSGAKDFVRFCEVADKHDLPVLLRPGPHINSEITGFGFPSWILNNEAIMARGPTGSPVTIPAPARAFHVPSYASKVFWAEVEKFFDALRPHFAQVFAPGGNAVALQADNENSYFFRTSSFDQDYHTDAIEQYREFLREKYQDPERCAEAYGRNSKPFESIDPPKKLSLGDERVLLRICDWVEFKEELAMKGVLKTAKLLRERLPEDANPLLFHNYPPCDLLASPFDVHGIEQRGIDIQGVDFYPTLEQNKYLYRQCRTLLGCSRFPFIPEMGAGSSPWNSVVRLEDERFTIPYCFMHGIKGQNFYMLVDRERWYGAPIAETGRVREDHKAFFQPFLNTMTELGISSLETPTEVAILASRHYQRKVHGTYLLSPIPPLLFSLMGQDASLSCSEHKYGYHRNLPIDYDETLNKWIALVSQLNVPTRIIEDAVELPPEQRRLVLVPAFQIMDEGLLAKLKRWSEDGSRIVLAPEMPEALKDLGNVELKEPCPALLADFIPEWSKDRDGELVEDVQVVLKSRGEDRFLFIANVGHEERQWTLPESLQTVGVRKLWGEATEAKESFTLPGKTVSVLKLGATLATA
ncbi:MAG: beta-galactosidase [Planctomycetota bacterium]|nr:beta-galactosidase [Planctomycetota bacterium]